MPQRFRPPQVDPEFSAWRAADGYLLRGRSWALAGASHEHAILYVHGIQSHGGWFEWSAGLLARYARVVLPDRRGSGMNSSGHGDIADWRRWIQDLNDIADCLWQEGVRRFSVVGVSWGGKPALQWALQAPVPLVRVLLVAPGLFPAVSMTALEQFRLAAALLLWPQKRFNIPLNDPALFTTNPVGRRFIERDPLKLTDATAEFLWQSHHLDRQLIEAPDGALRVPLTVALAGHDDIIRNQPTQLWARRVAGAGIRQQLFTAAHHTIEFEQDSAAFERFLNDWGRGIENHAP